MGMKATGYGRRMRNVRSLRHMLRNYECCFGVEKRRDLREYL